MGLKEDLENRVAEIFTQKWTERDGTVVPEAEALKLSNDAINLDGSVLYADLSGSTKLVDGLRTGSLQKSTRHTFIVPRRSSRLREASSLPMTETASWRSTWVTRRIRRPFVRP
jgi:hypothetical protein